MSTAQTRQGNLSIHTENIFPIIKKFLYSNQEVFLRELVSNAVDATRKLKTLAGTGEFQGELGELKVVITIDEAARTLTISDSGIGMTADEVEKYINQIAFSSAEEFLEKYKDANIIGHFGLGFYSAFMVANRVELVTRSYRDGAEAVRWTCEGSTTYSLEAADRERRGTDVILHIPEEHDEYLKSWRIQEILNRHCRFLPVEVEFDGKVVNDPNPLWTRKPADLTEQDYLDFYQKLYPMAEKPLFWIHLNVDYPFTLTGVLYFPRLKPGADFQKNKIHLYANQVFITDEVGDIVPDYLALLHGVIDSPDIPLNVSRSYLQTDAAVRKISGHVSKKVADKLAELFHDNRQDFEAKWDSVGLFVKYGMLRDNAFQERAEKFCLLYDVDDQFYTLNEYKEKVAASQTDKDGNVVYLYASDKKQQDGFIQAAKKRGYNVLLLDGLLDSNFLSYLETKLEKVTFARVDSGSLDKLIDKGIAKVSLLTGEEEETLKAAATTAVNDPLAAVQLQPLGEEELPVVVTRPEHQRRMMDMARNGLLNSEIPELVTILVNTAHPFAKKALLLDDAARAEALKAAYDLARLQQGLLTGSELTAFIQRAASQL